MVKKIQSCTVVFSFGERERERECGYGTNGVRVSLAGNIMHLHFPEGVSHVSVSPNLPLFFLAVLFISFFSLSLSSAFLLPSLRSSGIHTEKSILLGLFAFGREHRHIYINIHMRLFQILSSGNEPVDELFFRLIMKPVYMCLYG